ncbi:hypothetical protein GCM10029964_090430 [Kibdelosporangium lantanae]
MWRIGFRIWSIWQYLRLGIPGALLALVILLAQGASLLFWLLTLATVAAVAGARVVLGDLSRREADDPGRRIRR